MKTTFTAWTALAALATGLAWTGAAGADDIKIGYINKMGDHPWFVAEVAGAKKAAEEAGATFVSQDVQFDANLTITTFDTMVGDGVKGIAIVVPDKALGPVIAQKAKAAGIPLVAVDDDIYYEDGTQVPYVGHECLQYRRAGRRGAGEALQVGRLGRQGSAHRLDRGPQGRHLHAAQQGRRGGVPQGGSGFQARRTSSASPTTTRWSTPST